MSKSRGTGLGSAEVPVAGHEPGVAALLHRRQAQLNVEDVDFNRDDFTVRVNADLIGKYVNIASRGRLHRKRFGGRFSAMSASRAACSTRCAPTATPSTAFYEAREFGKVLREIMALADRVNESTSTRTSPGIAAWQAEGRGPAGRCTVASRPSACSPSTWKLFQLPALAAQVEAFQVEPPDSTPPNALGPAPSASTST